MDDNILARADALMQRRRAATPEPDDFPVLTEVASGAGGNVASDDDDFPVLTAAVTLPEPEPEVAAEAAPSPPGEAIGLEAEELARQIERRVLAELPRLIDEAVRAALAGRDQGTPPPPQR